MARLDVLGVQRRLYDRIHHAVVHAEADARSYLEVHRLLVPL